MKMPQIQYTSRSEGPGQADISHKLLLKEQEGAFRYGMGRTKFRAWAAQIGAKRKIGRCSLYDREVMDRAVRKGEAVHDN